MLCLYIYIYIYISDVIPTHPPILHTCSSPSRTWAGTLIESTLELQDALAAQNSDVLPLGSRKHPRDAVDPDAVEEALASRHEG